jgi:hypothetical protein
MSMQSEGKDAKGSMTGQGPIAAGASAGNLQQDVRTDDLLSDGSDSDRGQGFIGEEAGELQTGMAGIGSLSTGNAGNRQSSGADKPDEDALKGDR